MSGLPVAIRTGLSVAAALLAVSACGESERSILGPATMVQGSVETVGSICVENTPMCTVTDDTGDFEFSARVSGDLVLVFSGAEIAGRLQLSGIPAGASVMLGTVTCAANTCTSEEVRLQSSGSGSPPRQVARAADATVFADASRYP